MNGDRTMNNDVLDPRLTTKIVSSYVRHHTVGAGQVSELITSVYRALGQLGQPVQPQEVRTPAVSVRRSVHHDYVICLDCGYRGKTLRRHISTRHGLNRDDYLKRWGLKRDHPLTAPGYSEQRSMLAKERGLGRKPLKPTRRRSTRSASKSGDGAAPPTTRSRRPRSQEAPSPIEPT
jgi:predicted transcriptional regulator